jgi:hypothetical protein
MRNHRSPRRGAMLVVLAVIAATAPVILATGAPARAQGRPERSGNVSPRLLELSERAASGPTTDRADNLAVGLAPTGPGSLLRQAGQLVVNVRFASASTPADEARLRAMGAKVISSLPEEGLVSIATSASNIVAVASLPGVAWMEEVLEPAVHRGAGSAVRTGLAAALEAGGATTNATCAPVIS